LIKANEAGSRFKIIVTDGVFYGWCCPLDKICDLADKYDAMVMIDECHATGFIGDRKRHA
jgi:glycine C-acetyltransferase